MSNAPAAKVSIDPLEAAFDDAPWDEHPATEEEAEAMRLARAAEAEGVSRFVAGAEVTASIAERRTTRSGIPLSSGSSCISSSRPILRGARSPSERC